MALINRVARLFRADMHAVLDRIEEPEALLRQAVREMEEALGRDERRIALLSREQVLLVTRLDGVARSLADLEGELDLCFAADKQELARGLVKRKLEGQRLQRLLSSRREALERELGDLRAHMEENRGRLEGMRQKAELLAEERAVEPAGDVWPEATDVGVRDEEVEVAFLRELRKRRAPA